MICETCGNIFEKDWRKDKKSKKVPCRFCSKKCSNTRIHNEETKQKIKDSVVLFNKNNNRKINKKEKTCPICNNKFYVFNSERDKIYCNKLCYINDKHCVFRKKSPGGLRNGSGRSKSGYYKGFYCNSTWELCFYIFQIDNKISIERNKDFFIYKDEKNKLRKYYPDFIVDNKYIEIKGPQDKLWEFKLRDFPKDKQIVVFYEKDINFYIKYVKDKYGDILSLYDNMAQ